MKALAFRGPKKIEYVDCPDPSIEQSSDIIVKINRCSICGSDLHIYHGGRLGPFDYSAMTTQFCVGHEAIGEVVEVGSDVKSHRVGQRVTVAPGIGCGKCPACLRGQISLCQIPSAAIAFGISPILQGAQAEYLRVPFADLEAKTIPDGINDEQALLLTDALSTAYFGVQQAAIRRGDAVAVVGLGPIGLLAVECSIAMGAEHVYAIDMLADRRHRAEMLGATVLTPDEAVGIIREKTHGLGVDAVIEAVGAEASVSLALKIVRVGGRVSVLGMLQPQSKSPLGYMQLKNIHFFAGTASVIDTWPEVIALLQDGKLRAEGIFSHTFPLSEGARAYEVFDARDPGTLKMMLTV